MVINDKNATKPNLSNFPCKSEHTPTVNSFPHTPYNLNSHSCISEQSAFPFTAITHTIHHS